MRAVRSAQAKILSGSALTTQKIAASLAAVITRRSRRGARVLLLRGSLGSGKTTFVKGFLGFFGIWPHAASPTFVIMKRYQPKGKRRESQVRNIYHIDAYRLRSKRDVTILGVGTILSDPRAIVLVEWPERLKGMRWPRGTTRIDFSHGVTENERHIAVGK